MTAATMTALLTTMRRTPILWAAHLVVLCSTGLDPTTGRWPAERSPGGQLQSALSAAILANDRTFAIPAGVYHFEAHDLLADSARNLIIAPAPNAAVKLLFRCNWGLVLRSCANVTVRDLTIAYDPPCFSQGVVTSTTERSIRYTVDDAFPTPISDSRYKTAPIVKVIRWDPLTRLRVGKTLKLAYNTSQRMIRHLGGRSFELGAEASGGTEVGQLLTVGPRAGHTVLLTNCSICNVLGLTVHGSSDMALVEYGGRGGNIWRGNRVVRDPATQGLLASNADVFQSSGVERGPLVESNELSYAGDACLNQHNYFSIVLKRDTANPLRVLLLDAVGAHDIVGDARYAGAYNTWHQQLNTFSRVRLGDVARVYSGCAHATARGCVDPARLGLQLTTKVTAVEESTSEADLRLANSTLAGMGFHTNTRAWIGRVRCYWVSLANELPSALLWAFVNIDRLSGGGAVVRANIFHACGTLDFKSIAGSITDNIFVRLVLAASAHSYNSCVRAILLTNTALRSEPHGGDLRDNHARMVGGPGGAA